MRITDAADVLRRAGLHVVEVSGWKNRDNGHALTDVRGLTVHHTAGSTSSTVEGELKVLVNGRPGLSGPISQFMVSRAGVWYTVAAGAANHNKVGTAGPNKGLGNSHLLGVENQHHGSPEIWTPRQYDALAQGVAALAKHYKFSNSRVAGHKEHQPRQKPDPSFGMAKFRNDVYDWMKGGSKVPDEGKVENRALKPISGQIPTLQEGDKDPIDGWYYVSRLQDLLNIPTDGQYGPQTRAEVKEYNKSFLNRDSDGRSVDTAFWARLFGIR